MWSDRPTPSWFNAGCMRGSSAGEFYCCDSACRLVIQAAAAAAAAGRWLRCNGAINCRNSDHCCCACCSRWSFALCCRSVCTAWSVLERVQLRCSEVCLSVKSPRLSDYSLSPILVNFAVCAKYPSMTLTEIPLCTKLSHEFILVYACCTSNYIRVRHWIGSSDTEWPLFIESPWKILKFFSFFQGPGKSLKTDLVLEKVL